MIKNQINSFHKHIQAALDLNLPIIVHSRSAEEETFEAINSYKNSNLKILMHCFTGSLAFAKNCLNLIHIFQQAVL